MHKSVMDFLRNLPMFREYCNDNQFINSLAAQMKLRQFHSGEFIIRKGEQSQAMFFILKGSVEVISEDGDESTRKTMDVGSVFGEIGLLFSIPR